MPPVLGFDYWLLGRHTVIRMHYDEIGRYRGAETTPELLTPVVLERDKLWEIAEPFDTWYARHPELNRRSVA